MSKLEKQIARLLALPKDYTFNECASLLKNLGYEQYEGNGSRIKFIRNENEDKILLHRPHPKNEMKHYAIQHVIEQLKSNGDI